MAINVNGTVFRTRAEVIRANGNVVSECHVNGVKCYPEDDFAFVAVVSGSRKFHASRSTDGSAFILPSGDKTWDLEASFDMMVYSRSDLGVRGDYTVDSSEGSAYSYSFYYLAGGPIDFGSYGRQRFFVGTPHMNAFVAEAPASSGKLLYELDDPRNPGILSQAAYDARMRINISRLGVIGPAWVFEQNKNGHLYRFGIERYEVDNRIRNALNGTHHIRVGFEDGSDTPKTRTYPFEGEAIFFGGWVGDDDHLEIGEDGIVAIRFSGRGLELWAAETKPIVATAEFLVANDYKNYRDDYYSINETSTDTRGSFFSGSIQIPITTVRYVGPMKHLPQNLAL